MIHILFVIFKLALYVAAAMFLVIFINILTHLHYEIRHTRRGTIMLFSIRFIDEVLKAKMLAEKETRMHMHMHTLSKHSKFPDNTLKPGEYDVLRVVIQGV